MVTMGTAPIKVHYYYYYYYYKWYGINKCAAPSPPLPYDVHQESKQQTQMCKHVERENQPFGQTLINVDRQEAKNGQAQVQE